MKKRQAKKLMNTILSIMLSLAMILSSNTGLTAAAEELTEGNQSTVTESITSETEMTDELVPEEIAESEETESEETIVEETNVDTESEEIDAAEVSEEIEEETSEEENNLVLMDVSYDMVLNISELAIENGDLTANLTSGDFEIIATDGNKITIDNNSKSIDGFAFTRRLKTNGAGSTEARSIKFTTTGAATVDVYAISGSGSADRELVLLDADGKAGTRTQTALGSGITKLTFEVTAAGVYYLCSANAGINIYYIGVTNATQRPALPTVAPIATIDGKADVWDFGAEQLDASLYNNKLTVDIINGFYPGVAPGTSGIEIGSFTVKDASGNVALTFYGNNKTNNRIRSTNTALTRKDDKSFTYNNVTYTGYVYSNSPSTSSAYLGVAFNAGDIVTLVVTSNGNNSTIVCESPAGKKQSQLYNTTDKAGTGIMTFYIGETGISKFYSIDEKLCVARVVVQHTQPVNVVGYVDAPETLTNEYAVTFTNNQTGAVVEAPVTNGTYHTVLNDSYTYTVGLKNANGYVATNSELALAKGAGGSENYLRTDITVAAVELVKVSGTIEGLGDALSSLSLEFKSSELYIPSLKRNGTAYEVDLEKDVTYTLQISGIDDYSLTSASTVTASTDTQANITFAKKPVYDVTIAPTGATLSDLATAKFIFTRHSDANVTVEENYKYEFTGTDNIKLRDGVYTVAVTDCGNFEQKLTSNLKVEGAAVTKTIDFNNKNAQAGVTTPEGDFTVTVGATGCDYTTINDALSAIRKMNLEDTQRATIEIKPGDYEEMLVIDVPNITLKNASTTPSIETKDKGVNIDANAVRITSYYGHGYSYYSMNSNCKYDADLLAVNKANGYESFTNPGSGTKNDSYWNATVIIKANGFQAEGIIFENSFNQYVSKKAAQDVIVKQSSAKEGTTPRAGMAAGDTTVQNKKYVERAAALAIINNVQKVSFDNCSFIGRQDTLYGGTGVTAAFYQCKVYGGTDYIFGPMTAVFAKCDLVMNTMEDGNDVAYITAAQQASGRGYLMYNCKVTSTVPGVDTASEKISKAGYFGRPWAKDTAEVVYYATIIEKSCDDTSLIAPIGWNDSLSGTSNNVYEFGTYEILDGVDNSASRASWANAAAATIEGAKLKDGTAVTVANFLGSWDAFAGKDMTVVYPDGKETPSGGDGNNGGSATTQFILDTAADLTAFAEKAKADGDEEKAGTENFFTLIYSVKSKVDSSTKTFEDGYASSQRVNLGGAVSTTKNAIKFTTTEKATVKIWWVAGEAGRQVGIIDSQGTSVTATTGSSVKNTQYISSLKLDAAGTYYLGGVGGNSYIFKVEVNIEKPAKVSTFESKTDLTKFDKGAKANGEEQKTGTNNYFTIIYSASSKVDSSSKTFEDGYASDQRLNLGGKVTTSTNAVKFTTEDKAKVKIWWVENGSDHREVVILNSTGAQVVKTNANIDSNATCISTLDLAEAGTYYLGGDNGGIYIFKIEVTEGGNEVVRKSWTEVATPEITGAVSENGKITVSFNGVIGADGADKVKVVMLNESNAEVAAVTSAREGNSGSVEFTPADSGNYKFKIIAMRDEETDKVSAVTSTATAFVLPLTAPNVKSATSKGNGSEEIEWDAVKEAKKYKVYADGVFQLETAELKATITGLTVDKKYTFAVEALRDEDVSAKGSIQATVVNEVQRTWAFSAYGTSTDTKNNGYTGNINEGPVTIYSESGKGKIVPASTDGLAFYYTKINPETENFTLTATLHVDKWTLSNGQEGFGIMATDTIGLNGSSTDVWNNSYMAVGTKVEYRYDGTNFTTDTNYSKVEMYLGLGALARTGVTKADLSALADKEITIPVAFESVTVPLELSGLGVGRKVNLFKNCTISPEGGQGTLTEVKLQLQRNNDGYILRYLSADGTVIGEKLYYDQERTALTQLDENNIYIGFFAARNMRITVSDVTLTTIAPEDDAPMSEREVEVVNSISTVESVNYSNTAQYELAYYGNMDGKLTIKAQDGTLVKDEHVSALTKIRVMTNLNRGNNTFTVTFVPDENYTPGPYKRMSSLDTVVINHTVTYNYIDRTNIYVSPTGKSSGSGSKEDPRDLQTALNYAKPGTRILLAGGTYRFNGSLKIERGINGTADAMIYMMADPEATERPVIDFGGRGSGFIVAGNYWYLQGFDVTGSANGSKGLQVSGNNNTLDQINTYKNGNTGLQICRYLATDGRDQWPSNNLILNCTSYLNADQGYEDADGFAAKLTCGDGNVFDGCVAMYNADDGWDLYAKVATGSIGVVTLKNCVAYKNGYVLRLDGGTGALDLAGTEVNAGNGNGFKMGGDGLAGGHILMNSVAYANKAKGIDSNSCPDIKVYNCTSYNNGSYNVALYTKNNKNTAFVAQNVVSYKDANGNGVADDWQPLGTQVVSDVINTTYYFFDGSTSENSAGARVAATWFASVDMSKGYAVGLNRNADGTLNMDGFLETTAAAGEIGAKLDAAHLTASAEISVDKNADAYKPSSGDTSASVTEPETETVTVNVTYSVVKGDTLSRIAKKYNLTLNQLLALNPQIKNPNLIYIGQQIVVGTATETRVKGEAEESKATETVESLGEYIVQKSDCLSKIARKNGMTLAELLKLNPQIKNPNLIYVGQKITIYKKEQ